MKIDFRKWILIRNNSLKRSTTFVFYRVLLFSFLSSLQIFRYLPSSGEEFIAWITITRTQSILVLCRWVHSKYSVTRFRIIFCCDDKIIKWLLMAWQHWKKKFKPHTTMKEWTNRRVHLQIYGLHYSTSIEFHSVQIQVLVNSCCIAISIRVKFF